MRTLQEKLEIHLVYVPLKLSTPKIVDHILYE